MPSVSLKTANFQSETVHLLQVLIFQKFLLNKETFYQLDLGILLSIKKSQDFVLKLISWDFECLFNYLPPSGHTMKSVNRKLTIETSHFDINAMFSNSVYQKHREYNRLACMMQIGPVHTLQFKHHFCMKTFFFLHRINCDLDRLRTCYKK